MVEMALVLPLFLILVMSIVDLGLALRAYLTVTNSAREGARYGTLCPASDNDIKNRVADYSNGLLAADDVTIQWQGGVRCTTDKYVSVEAEYDYTFITPLGVMLGIVVDKVPITSTTKMRIE